VEIHVQSVGIDGAHGPLLEPTSLRVRTGELALVAGEPGTGHTAFALALGGRMQPSVGTVLLDGKADDAGLRRLVAIVDAPDVSAPEEALTLGTVIGEELAFAKQPANRKAVADWLLKHDAREHANARFEAVPAEVRTRLLVEAASQRPGIGALVLVLPDRHGAGPHTWWTTASTAAERGLAVVVLCSETSARLLDVPAARIGDREQPETLAFTQVQEDHQ
jgi:energy-coupling factor transporter ATP-binding protein EcfA2